MTEPSTSIHGVQNLIDRLRDEGIQQAEQQAKKILEESRKEAAAIIAEAKAEVDEMRTTAEAEIESREKSAMEALKLAARDTVLNLKSGVGRAFEQHVRRLVSSATMDKELIRMMVLLLAGKTAQEITKDKELEIMVSRALFEDAGLDKPLEDRLKQQILALSSEMLREGVDLIPASDVHGGARVRLVGENLEIDLTDKAISDLLIRYMNPRFISILVGEEG